MILGKCFFHRILLTQSYFLLMEKPYIILPDTIVILTIFTFYKKQKSLFIPTCCFPPAIMTRH